jgi:uncharacterized protein YraI
LYKTLVSRKSLLVLALSLLTTLALLPAPASAGDTGNSPIAAAALRHLDTHGGQCWTFMQQVVSEATGRHVGNDYRQGYFDAGAVEVSAADATNGDIIQIADDSNTSPWASYAGLHTAIILKNLGGGTFDAVDSNQNWDEMVHLRPNYNPYESAARNGLQVHIYRIPAGGAGAADAGVGVSLAAGDHATVQSDPGCLNMRTDASLAGKVVDCLPTGTDATIVDGPVSADGYSWVKVETSQGTGWVASRYLVKTAPTANASAASDTAPAAPAVDTAVSASKVVHVDNSPGCLRMRDTAGLGGAILECLSAGTALTVLDDSGVSADGYTWTRVSLSAGVEGWVASAYLIS